MVIDSAVRTKLAATLAVGGLHVTGETAAIHQGRTLHPLPQRPAKAAEPIEILGQIDGPLYELPVGPGHQLRQAQMIQMARTGAAHHGITHESDYRHPHPCCIQARRR